MKSLYLAAAVTLALGVSACGQAPAAGQPQIPATTAAAAQKQPAPAGQKVSDEITKAITTTLERNYADQKLKVESVSTTPVAGLYEIVVNGKQIAYTDATGQYMFVGDLIQTDIAKSLTEERKAVLNAVDFNKLPFDLAIKEVRGNGELKIAVFSDADCPFCKRLEHEFAKMTNDHLQFHDAADFAAPGCHTQNRANPVSARPDQGLDGMDARRQNAAYRVRLRQSRHHAANAGIERATGLQRHADFGLPERHGAKRLFTHAGA